jgi:cytochrome b6-f complex iron-sulfur subunit
MSDEELTADSGKKISRGAFFRYSGRAVGTVVAGGWVVGLGRYLASPSVETPTRFALGAAPPAGPGAAVRFFSDARVFLCADGDGWYALEATCTHLGCTPDIVADGFACPCHGSRYDTAGAVTQGPANKDLPQLRLSVRDGLLWVDRSAEVARGSRLRLSQASDAPSEGS